MPIGPQEVVQSVGNTPNEAKISSSNLLSPKGDSN
jgi:hypothetical protein